MNIMMIITGGMWTNLESCFMVAIITTTTDRDTMTSHMLEYNNPRTTVAMLIASITQYRRMVVESIFLVSKGFLFPKIPSSAVPDIDTVSAGIRIKFGQYPPAIGCIMCIL